MPSVLYRSNIYELTLFTFVFDFVFFVLKSIVQVSAVVAEHG